MKALIFNSGLGNRMGALTAKSHKSMVRLRNGESLFSRQLRLLAAAGIEDVVVTTGPFEEQLRLEAARHRDLRVKFVRNSHYAETNYIYSMYLARNELDSDLLMLHGDLVFSNKVLHRLLHSEEPNLGAVNPEEPLPDKDFKARISAGRIVEISVDITGPDCVAFQPLYKLNREFVSSWLREVDLFVRDGDCGVYAENALNRLLPNELELLPFSYAKHLVAEIDTPDDHRTQGLNVRNWDFREQKIVVGTGSSERIPELLGELGTKSPLLIGHSAADASAVGRNLSDTGFHFTTFKEYSPNPTIEEVLAGLRAFEHGHHDSLVAVGGGSAIDTAKAIKSLLGSDGTEFTAEGAPFARNVPLIAAPTTAGTGSESTHFAVVYVDGKKTSVAHDALLPDYAILDPKLLRSLPEYHKRASLLDALGQCVESLWAKAATQESRDYARRGIELIVANSNQYLAGPMSDLPSEVIESMQIASNMGGRAINLSKTTAPHAMSYGLTGHFGIAHGHAVALCLIPVLDQHLKHRTAIPSLDAALKDLQNALGLNDPEEVLPALEEFVDNVGLVDLPDAANLNDLSEQLAATVDGERLGNNPAPFSRAALKDAYLETLLKGQLRRRASSESSTKSD